MENFVVPSFDQSTEQNPSPNEKKQQKNNISSVVDWIKKVKEFPVYFHKISSYRSLFDLQMPLLRYNNSRKLLEFFNLWWPIHMI